MTCKFALEISSKIKKKREKLGLNQKEFGRLIGVGRTQIINIESGYCDMPARKFLLAMSLKRKDLYITIKGLTDLELQKKGQGDV